MEFKKQTIENENEVKCKAPKAIKPLTKWTASGWAGKCVYRQM